ncbi:cell division protein FtsZ [Acetobacteraceae bacterium]|nr:cell division protein FtsZ [Acetobacteraceae bacterium]
MSLELQPPSTSYGDNHSSIGGLRADAARIVVMGVGGGGGNSVGFMVDQGIQGAEFVIANTDMQVLLKSSVKEHIQLGPHETRGLGAGGKPEVGELASREVEDDIAKRLKGVDLLFLTAGMGGGTGTGATPVIASIAKKLNVLTTAIVTKPFAWEGKQKAKMAEAGIKRLRENVDTLIVVPNENLEKVDPNNKDLTIEEGFQMSNQVLLDSIRSVTDIRQKVGLINIDFKDLETILQNGGVGLVGTGRSFPDDPTEDRAILAAERAINNPLLERSNIQGAQNLLVHVRSRKGDLRLKENTKAMDYVQEAVKGDLQGKFIYGIFETDEVEEGCIEISIIATGLDAGELDAPIQPTEEKEYNSSYAGLRSNSYAPTQRPAAPAHTPSSYPTPSKPHYEQPHQAPVRPAERPMPIPEPPKVEESPSRGFWGIFRKPRQQAPAPAHPVKTDNSALPQRPRRDINDVKDSETQEAKMPDYLSNLPDSSRN